MVVAVTPPMTDLVVLSALAVLAMLAVAFGVTRLLDYLLTARLADEMLDEPVVVRRAPMTVPLRALVA